MTTATARYTPQTKNGKSQYNTALEHFQDQGRLSIRDHTIQPENFIDRALATAMYGLVDRLRTWDSPEKSRVHLKTFDTPQGLEIIARCDGKRVTFFAEPVPADDETVKYDARVELNHSGLPSQKVQLVQNSKAALRGISKKSSKNWFQYLTGYRPRE